MFIRYHLAKEILILSFLSFLSNLELEAVHISIFLKQTTMAFKFLKKERLKKRHFSWLIVQFGNIQS